MTTAHDQNLVRRVVAEIVNTGRLELADECFAHDYVNHGGLIPDLVSGPEAIKVSVVLYRRAFPNLYVTIDALGREGNLLVMDWTARNRHPDRSSGHVGDRPLPDRLTGTTRIRCTHGQIVESWTDWDSAGTMQRTGLTTAAGVAA
jgi:hypothetical protein